MALLSNEQQKLLELLSNEQQKFIAHEINPLLDDMFKMLLHTRPADPTGAVLDWARTKKRQKNGEGAGEAVADPEPSPMSAKSASLSPSSSPTTSKALQDASSPSSKSPTASKTSQDAYSRFASKRRSSAFQAQKIVDPPAVNTEKKESPDPPAEKKDTASTGSSVATPTSIPIALVLQLEIREDCVDEFVKVMTADANGSRQEPGCLHFDLLHDKDNDCKFITYEVFESAEALELHKEMAHVKAWGAFQYGDRKPVVSKNLLKLNGFNFQRGKNPNNERPKFPPTALMLEVGVKEDCIPDFLEVMTNNALKSREEPGCLRSDILRNPESPDKFIIYEVFASSAAMDAHTRKPYVDSWGEFQYGDKRHPVQSKKMWHLHAMDFQSHY